MITEIINDAEAHKGMASVIAMWIMRETPVFYRWLKATGWPTLKAIYPWIVENRGIGPIIGRFFWIRKSIAIEAALIQPQKPNTV